MILGLKYGIRDLRQIMWMIYLWIAIVIGFVNDFVIEKGIGKVSLQELAVVGERRVGWRLEDAFFYFEKNHISPASRAVRTNGQTH
jgi:hypothetical protein